MTARFVCAVALLSGCGRVAFDQTARADGPPLDDLPAGDAPPASRCAGLGVLMCDGFEQATLDSRWMTDIQRGSIAIDPGRAYRGGSSVRVHTNAITASEFDVRAMLVGDQGISGGSVTGLIYVRAWAYFVSPPTNVFNQIINFSDGPGNGISFGAREGFVVNNDYTSAVYEQSTTVQLPTDRWTCLEMAMPSGTTDTARIYVDGQEVADVAIPKATAQPNPTHMYLGIEWVATIASQAAVDAWFDEVIVDDAPTTCAD